MHIRNYFSFLDSKRIEDISDVALALRRLNHHLERTSLGGLVYFNKTYLIITQNVRRAVADGRFEHPDFLRHFDTRFAFYYFSALRRYLESKPAPPAWQRAFEASRSGRVSPIIAMALGVNAHVNNDIPQVLQDTKAMETHRRDYNLVNKIIRDSVNEVLDGLDATTHVLDPKRRLLKPLYKRVMDIVIARWRVKAWKHFERLKSHATTTQDIEKYASMMERELRKLPV